MAQRSNSTPTGRRPGRPARADVFARLDSGIAELRDGLGGLPTPAVARLIWDDIWVHEAHNSTALESTTYALSWRE